MSIIVVLLFQNDEDSWGIIRSKIRRRLYWMIVFLGKYHAFPKRFFRHSIILNDLKEVHIAAVHREKKSLWGIVPPDPHRFGLSPKCLQHLTPPILHPRL